MASLTLTCLPKGSLTHSLAFSCLVFSLVLYPAFHLHPSSPLSFCLIFSLILYHTVCLVLHFILFILYPALYLILSILSSIPSFISFFAMLYLALLSYPLSCLPCSSELRLFLKGSERSTLPTFASLLTPFHQGF